MKNIFTKGQSLFEVMFAVGIAALVLIAIVGLSTQSVKDSDYSKNNALATKYAQEGIELVRQTRDQSGWDSFIAEYYPGSENDQPITGNDLFTRTFRLDSSGANLVTVTVTVSWTDGSGTHEVKSATKLSNWRN